MKGVLTGLRSQKTLRIRLPSYPRLSLYVSGLKRIPSTNLSARALAPTSSVPGADPVGVLQLDFVAARPEQITSDPIVETIWRSDLSNAGLVLTGSEMAKRSGFKRLRSTGLWRGIELRWAV